MWIWHVGDTFDTLIVRQVAAVAAHSPFAGDSAWFSQSCEHGDTTTLLGSFANKHLPSLKLSGRPCLCWRRNEGVGDEKRKARKLTVTGFPAIGAEGAAEQRALRIPWNFLWNCWAGLNYTMRMLSSHSSILSSFQNKWECPQKITSTTS